MDDYLAALAWHERNCPTGYVAPCQPPDQPGPCPACEFFGKPVAREINPVAAFLAGDYEPEVYVNPGRCAMHLRMYHHPYTVGGEGGCRKCHAARSHGIHFIQWEAHRRLWGFT